MHLAITGIIGVAAAGYFIDKAGEGAEDFSNAAIKAAVVGAFGVWLYKKAKAA